MSRQKISLNTLSGPDSRDLSVRYPADRIRVSAWFCQKLLEVPACYLGITRGRVRPFYLPVLPLYGFTKLYTNPFLLIYLLPNFKLPVLVLIWGLKQKKLNSGSHRWLCLHGMSSTPNLLPLFPSRKSCCACGSGHRDRSPSPSSVYLNVLIRCRLGSHFYCLSPCFGDWERFL
jgi:hypothetical protein